MSSSKSSSASVRNPYSSYSYRPVGSSNSDFNYEFAGVKCRCDLPAPCQEAWKRGTLDPGRRFFGCSRYKDPSRRCDFFVWADPTYPERARDVIQELMDKLKRKDEQLQKAKLDMDFVEMKMLVLDEEVALLRKQLAEGKTGQRKEVAEGKTGERVVTIRRLLMLLLVFVIFSVMYK